MTVVACGIVGVACGLDDTGTQAAPVPGQDASVPVEAAPIPRADGAADDAGDSAADAATAPTCPPAFGAMVLVDAGGLLFCIDSTEVTNASYNVFVGVTGGSPASGVVDASVPTGCAGNVTFNRLTGAGDASTEPASNIDWCDAFAFCAWAGKRLCGKTVGGDASTGEWFTACSNGGAQTHAYGNGYVAGACNEDATGTLMAAPVGSFPGCEGGVPGIVDMNGNVRELIDDCDLTTCSAAGGYYFAPTTGCAVSALVAKSVAGAATGFRCCADPK